LNHQPSILESQGRYQRTAMPFEWKFTKDDLSKPMKKLTEEQAPLARATPQKAGELAKSGLTAKDGKQESSPQGLPLRNAD
jgi:hypothetical protein